MSCGCFDERIFVYIIMYVFLASGIFVFDEIFGVRFFKKQELCHFEPLQKVKNPYFKVQTRTLNLWILHFATQSSV